MRVEKIVSNLLESNTFLIFEGDDCLIIDAGVDVKTLMSFIGDRKVVGVFLTHGHYDHVYYVEEYKKVFDCKVYINNLDKDFATNKELNYGFAVKDKGIFTTFDKDTTFNIKNFEVNAFLTPGHSPGGVCYLIGEHLFAGDTLFNGGIGRYDLAGSNKYDLIKSLVKLQKIKFDILHSGHGEDSTYLEQQRNISAYLHFLSKN